jgi:hypothetical protein
MPREKQMKKPQNDFCMLEEYDFSGGVRGKYAKRYAEGANVFVLDTDFAEYFLGHDDYTWTGKGLKLFFSG